MSVKRYWSYAGGDSSMQETETGNYVKHEDYVALEQKLTDMAVQLANAESKCRELAGENAYLMPKAASELSNAWVLHKYLIGIQAAIMYLDNGNKKAAQEWLYGTIAGPGFEFPDEVENIDEWATHQMRGSVSHQQALEIIKAETTVTDAFLADVMAQGVEMMAAEADQLMDEFGDDSYKVMVTADLQRFANAFAAQLRKGVQS
ncbi:hypothetical protein [Citrobacter sp. Res13-Lact-LER2-35-b]|uniref:hypothetical protein n=1 Tax=Citrobacter sp. Res13-Lact-LER2-35-b TaxID=2777957 RepID=UPI0018ABAE04|nr:hypothetical protein [Citrobacter sp. Res13-Lact-LER2-35-b]